MARSFVFELLVLTFFTTGASAQFNSSPFCPSGLHADGYIDFSGLPAAPSFPQTFPGHSSGPSVPFSATLPVSAVPGLSVQVTIPSLQSIQGSVGPVYSVINGTLVLNGNPTTSGDGELILLQFNHPVKGIGLLANSVGRGATYTLQALVAPAPTPVNFQNTSSTDTVGYHFLSTPLEEVALEGTFDTAAVSFSGGGYGNPSLADLRVQSAASSIDVIPKEGLQQWLISESAGSPFAGTASSWPDQSGSGHNATQSATANQPQPVEADGNSCQGAFSFGQSQYFNFNLPLDGWEQMTIFLVAKSWLNPPAGSQPSPAAAIFWNENAFGGSTFVAPYQTSVSFSFGTTQAGNQPVYNRPVTVGQDFTVTRAVYNRTTDSLYINGLLVLSQANELPALSGATGTGYIGRGINGASFNGEIGEVLVYNRVLSEDEAAAVESYLRNKFGTR